MIHAYWNKAVDLLRYVEWWEFGIFGSIFLWVLWELLEVSTVVQFVRLKMESLWWRLRGSRD